MKRLAQIFVSNYILTDQIRGNDNFLLVYCRAAVLKTKTEKIAAHYKLINKYMYTLKEIIKLNWSTKNNFPDDNRYLGLNRIM